ncbi:MAG: 50S ribosomal protein L2 [Candidatus Nealsonbacteria bacterium]|nr:50S ribosomal protein L2 [Candidatus Nealsonbacteria bacterium]
MLKNLATKENFRLLTKKKPEKGLLLKLQQRSGRGSSGRITVRHQGGGAKKLYRLVDFGQEKLDIKAKVASLEYDPYRSSFIMLLEYQGGDKRYRLAPQGLKVGDSVVCQEKADLNIGNRMKLRHIPVGTSVYNIELIPGQGGKLARGAGTSAKVLAHEEKYCNIEMPSGEVRRTSEECFASIGALSRAEHIYTVLGKAGKARHKGIRPSVKGSAMIPADHPHGGGEGRAPIGLKYPKTPWGKHALGVKTRKRHLTDKYIIQRRSKKSKK